MLVAEGELWVWKFLHFPCLSPFFLEHEFYMLILGEKELAIDAQTALLGS